MEPIDFVIAGEQVTEEVVLVPFEESVFGLTISGVRPDGWDPLGNGAWARGASALDATVLVQQAAPVALEPDEALNLLLSSIEFEEGPDEVDTVAATDRTWTVYEGVAQGELTLIAVGPGAETTGVVIFSVNAEERVKSTKWCRRPSWRSSPPADRSSGTGAKVDR